MGTSISTWFRQFGEIDDGVADASPVPGEASGRIRVSRNLTVGIVSGLLLSSSLIGSAINSSPPAPNKPALDLTAPDFSNVCGDPMPACGGQPSMAGVDYTFTLSLQFADSPNPGTDLIHVAMANIPTAAEGSYGSGNTVSDVPGGASHNGFGGGSAGGAAGGGSAEASRLLAVVNAPGTAPAQPSGGLPLALAPGKVSPGDPNSDKPALSAAPVDTPKPAKDRVPGKTTPSDPDNVDKPVLNDGPGDIPKPAKAPVPLVPGFTPELGPVIVRVGPADVPLPVVAPHDGGPLPPELIPGAASPKPQTGITPTADLPVPSTTGPLVVPEPSAFVLLGLGLVCFGARRRKQS